MLDARQIATLWPELLQRIQEQGPQQEKGLGEVLPESAITHHVEALTGTTAGDAHSSAYRWRRAYYDPLVSRVMPLLGFHSHTDRSDQFGRVHCRLSTEQTPYEITLAKGFRCHVTHAVFDEENRPLFLRLFGPQWAVEANWSALVNGRKERYINGRRLLYEGGLYTHKKQTLPCGWMEAITWHKNSDYRTAENGAHRVYVLSPTLPDGKPPRPFATLLQATLPIPTKPEWMPILWSAAHSSPKRLIHSLERTTQLFGWSIRLDKSAWIELVERGLACKALVI